MNIMKIFNHIHNMPKGKWKQMEIQTTNHDLEHFTWEVQKQIPQRT